MTDLEMEIYRQVRQLQDKYVYFLLAAAGASIAFALNQTNDIALSWDQWPLAVAVGCWAFSFVAGCAKILAVEEALHINRDLLDVQSGSHPLLESAAEIPFAAGILKKRLEKWSTVGQSRQRWQLWLILVGGVAYIGWHVWEMGIRAGVIAAGG